MKNINDRRSARLRVKYRAAYAETNKRIKRKIPTDENAFIEELPRVSRGSGTKGRAGAI